MDYQTYHSTLPALFAHLGEMLYKQLETGFKDSPDLSAHFPIETTQAQICELRNGRHLNIVIYRMQSGKSFELVTYLTD